MWALNMHQNLNINKHFTSYTFEKKPYKNIALGLQNMHQKFNIHTHLTCTFKNQNSQKLNTLVLKYA